MPPPVEFCMQFQLAFALSHEATVLDWAAQLDVLALLILITLITIVVGNYRVVFDFLLVAPRCLGSLGVLFGHVYDQELKPLA